MVSVKRANMFSSYKKVLATSLCALSLLAGATAAHAEEITVSGSTTVLPVMQKASEGFMKANPDIKLIISGGGTGSGIKALSEGLCDIAMASRDIKKAEVELALKKDIHPNKVTIAIDALAPVINPENPVTNLSLEQLKDIYSGKITNWKELGGKDGNIVVISRDSSSGTFETWSEIVMKGDKVDPRAMMQASNGGVAQIIAKNKRAIGYIGMGYLNNQIKALHINNVAPEEKTALDKTWPLSRELFVFTNGEPSGATKRLCDYLVNPQQGQKAVSEIGFIPVAK